MFNFLQEVDFTVMREILIEYCYSNPEEFRMKKI